MEGQDETIRSIVGGVDTHKDLHVAAVVDDLDRATGRVEKTFASVAFISSMFHQGSNAVIWIAIP